jgi:integrase
MGLYKLCGHKGRARDRCSHPWWGSFQYKGRLHRASLARWADEKIDGKAWANDVFDRMCNAIRAGNFAEHEEHADLTFTAFADVYLKRYVELRALRSRDYIEWRLAILKGRWKGRRLADIRVAEIEDLIQDLRTKGARGKRPAKPATINRYLALLRHMMNWAVAREYIEREDNRRIRRVSPEEEAHLLTAGNAVVRMMLVAALDTGMRRGELLALRFGDRFRPAGDPRPGGARQEQEGPGRSHRHDAAA